GAGEGTSVRADVRDALAGLGYGADEIARVLADLPDADGSSELLRQALQRLAAARGARRGPRRTAATDRRPGRPRARGGRAGGIDGSRRRGGRRARSWRGPGRIAAPEVARRVRGAGRAQTSLVGHPGGRQAARAGSRPLPV